MSAIEIWIKGVRVEGGFETIPEAEERLTELKKHLRVEVID